MSDAKVIPLRPRRDPRRQRMERLQERSSDGQTDSMPIRIEAGVRVSTLLAGLASVGLRFRYDDQLDALVIYSRTPVRKG